MSQRNSAAVLLESSNQSVASPVDKLLAVMQCITFVVMLTLNYTLEFVPGLVDNTNVVVSGAHQVYGLPSGWA
jgi:hypothetical protein